MATRQILLAHGSGGKLSHRLIEEYFLPAFENPILKALGDSATLELEGQRLAFTTDPHVVDPIFFPGGDIGRLAVTGTVNDLAMSGASPKYLAASFIIEEGLPLETLQRLLESMKRAAREAGVQIAAGDTKVVQRGACDRIFITTTGVGTIPRGLELSGRNVTPGDKVLASGFLGDHAIAVLSQREGLGFETSIESDCAPLHGLVAELLAASSELRWMRDPTRGGLATTLNELAGQRGVAITVEEERLPFREEVKGACEILGFDPVYLASEGKLIAVVGKQEAEKVVAAMRAHRYGSEAAIIGELGEEGKGVVLLRTAVGGTRVLDMLTGEQLPRIC